MREGFETQYHRVIGGSAEEKREVQEILQHRIETPYSYRPEQVRKYEQEPTEDQKTLIAWTEQSIRDLVKEYGGDPTNFPLFKIHLMQPGSVETITEGKLSSGIFLQVDQEILVENYSNIDLAVTLAHELLHAESYKSAQITAEKEAAPYRTGITMHDRTNPAIAYFSGLEDAIVQEAALKFFTESMAKNPLFEQQINKIEQVKNRLKEFIQNNTKITENEKKDALVRIHGITDIPEDEMEGIFTVLDSNELGRLYKNQIFNDTARIDERIRFSHLLDEIQEKSNGFYVSRDDVLDEFMRANFSGNILPIARNVEKFIGKGAFRKIAEDFQQ